MSSLLMWKIRRQQRFKKETSTQADEMTKQDSKSSHCYTALFELLINVYKCLCIQSAATRLDSGWGTPVEKCCIQQKTLTVTFWRFSLTDWVKSVCTASCVACCVGLRSWSKWFALQCSHILTTIGLVYCTACKLLFIAYLMSQSTRWNMWQPPVLLVTVLWTPKLTTVD
jgi:hypothetical protein